MPDENSFEIKLDFDCKRDFGDPLGIFQGKKLDQKSQIRQSGLWHV